MGMINFVPFLMKYDVIYNITQSTDGNGEITLNRVTSPSGNMIVFEVKANKGYRLKKVTVTTKSGKSLTFTDYRFTMPDEDVEVYAEFEKTNILTNPLTGSNKFITIPFILIIILISVIGINNLKNKKINNNI